MTATVVMYDDVNVDLIPADAQYIAVYADGTYQNLAAAKARFPKAVFLGIDVQGFYRNGDILDVERGDATNAAAVGWFKGREGHTRTPKPWIYTSASNIQALIAAMRAAGITRDRYLIWSAHYTGRAHICGRGCGYPQADATQWTNRALSRSLDESLVEDYGLPQATVIGGRHPRVEAMRTAGRKALRAHPVGPIADAVRTALRAIRGIR